MAQGDIDMPHETATSLEPDLSIESLQADLFVLMTHYGAHPSRDLAHAIAESLHRVARHPLFSLFPVRERRAVARLARVWRNRSSGLGPQMQ
jgi:hypothetical protein